MSEVYAVGSGNCSPVDLAGVKDALGEWLLSEAFVDRVLADHFDAIVADSTVDDVDVVAVVGGVAVVVAAVAVVGGVAVTDFAVVAEV